MTFRKAKQFVQGHTQLGCDSSQYMTQLGIQNQSSLPPKTYALNNVYLTSQWNSFQVLKEVSSSSRSGNGRI